MSDRSWLKRRAEDAASTQVVGCASCEETYYAPCVRHCAEAIEVVAREFAERAIAAREINNAVDNGFPAALIDEVLRCYRIEIADAIASAGKDE